MSKSTPIRIAFVGRFYWHNGSSHALLGYVRAGRHLQWDVRVSSLGIVDETVRRMVPVADVDWRPDLMVFVFEERFLRPEAWAHVEKTVPRSRRVVIDPDGKYSPVTTIGSDTNHPTPDSRRDWSTDYERLSDVILQPCLGPLAPGVRRFFYFGVDRHRSRSDAPAGEKPYDIVYVGNNWYRWHDIVWFFEGLSRVRSKLGRIAIFGGYWSGDPLEGYEDHTWSDPDFLLAHGVETYPSVPFDAVELTMGQGRLCPVFLRPVLNTLGLVTPRMFETFAADTVPIFPPYVRHAAALYGDEVAPLCLGDDPADAVMKILNEYPAHASLAREIGTKLAREHSYEVRLNELTGFLP
jgi:hypothetical protein